MSLPQKEYPDLYITINQGIMWDQISKRHHFVSKCGLFDVDCFSDGIGCY